MVQVRLNRLAIWFVVFMLCVFTLNGILLLQVFRLHSKSLAVQENRQESLNLSYSIQQETAALSRMVRAYTTSANTRYLTYYYDIIDIRAGRKAAPAEYSSTYWSEVMAGERKHLPLPKKPGVSLLNRMETYGFGREEFTAIDRVLQCSEKLYEQDQIAFAATQGLYNPEKNTFVDEGAPQRQFANQFVYSEQYLKLENALNQDVAAFVQLTDKRTRESVAAVTKQLTESIIAAIIVLVITVIAALLTSITIRTMVLAPMRRLIHNASAIGAGNYSVRTDTEHGVEEIKALGHTFNKMAANIEEDIQQHEHIAKQLEVATQKARESTRAKSLFLANMSHEIRTPMNAIIGMTYLALKTNLDEHQRDYVHKIQKASQSLLGIINDILDFSKIEAGKLSLERVEFRLEDVLAHSMLLIRERAAEKGIHLLLDVKHPHLLGDSGVFLGDPLRIGQILTNLLANAVKFTRQGHVRLIVEEIDNNNQKSELQFSVEDTGIGLTPEQVGMLFQEFSQVDGSTTRKYGGTGLGLSISKRLVNLMDGRLSVASQFEQGSVFTFTVTLPEILLPTEQRFEGDNLARTLSALIVDGDERSGAALQSILQYFKIDTRRAFSGDEALRMISEEKNRGFDVLFVDWQIPAAGDKSLSVIIGASAIKKPFVCVTSSENFEKLPKRDEIWHNCFYLQKPILPADIRKLLGRFANKDNRQTNADDEAQYTEINNMRILLVEDNAFNQQIAIELLNSHQVQIDIAMNGEEAIQMLDAHPEDYYHLVLMDIQMPVMDGFEATKILRRQPRYDRLPIIAMTAHAMIEEQQRCIAVGMNAHIAKPIHPDVLYQTIKAFGAPPTVDEKEKLLAHKTTCLTPFFSIPHLDAESGLAYCANSPKMYMDALKNYSNTYADIREKMATMSMSDQWPDMTRLAHNFKTMSATIGATRLKTLGQELEAACHHQSPGLQQLLNELDAALQPFLQSLASALNEQSNTT